ncbi:MAG: hypothetical protein AAF496_14165, partial [Pseudomonadota bacterium]
MTAPPVLGSLLGVPAFAFTSVDFVALPMWCHTKAGSVDARKVTGIFETSHQEDGYAKPKTADQADLLANYATADNRKLQVSRR